MTKAFIQGTELNNINVYVVLRCCWLSLTVWNTGNKSAIMQYNSINKQEGLPADCRARESLVSCCFPAGMQKEILQISSF